MIVILSDELSCILGSDDMFNVCKDLLVSTQCLTNDFEIVYDS